MDVDGIILITDEEYLKTILSPPMDWGKAVYSVYAEVKI